MIRFAAFGLLGCLLAGSSFAGGSKSNNETLQGLWVVQSITENGKAIPKSELKGLRLTVKGKNLVMSRGKKKLYTGVYVQGRSKKLKTLDITFTWKKKKFQWKAIYKLQGNILTVCGAPKGKKRPTEFTCKKGSGRQLAIYKRAKK